MKKKSTSTRSRSYDVGLLKAFGSHSKKIRVQKGLSIDRLAKESDRLSPSVIHRLENGTGAVTLNAVFKYADALNIDITELFNFPHAQRTASAPWLSHDDPSIQTEAFKTLLPAYTIKAAAGKFGDGRNIEPEGWVKVRTDRKLNRNMFIVQAIGKSMQPKINDGDYLVFEANPAGSRQNKIVLVQYRGPADPETGGSFTVKQYHSAKSFDPDGGWQHQQIELRSLNPDYESIMIPKDHADDFKVVAEFLFKL